MKRKKFSLIASAIALIMSVIMTLGLAGNVSAQVTSTQVFFYPAPYAGAVSTAADLLSTAKAFLAAHPGVKKVIVVTVASTGPEDSRRNPKLVLERGAQGGYALILVGYTGEVHYEVREATPNNQLQRGVFFVAADGLTEAQVQGLISNSMAALEAKMVELIQAEAAAREAEDKKLDERIETTNRDLENEAVARESGDTAINDRIANFGLDFGPSAIVVAPAEGQAFNLIGGSAAIRMYRLRLIGGMYYGGNDLPDIAETAGIGVEAIRVDMGEPGGWTYTFVPEAQYFHMSVDVDNANTAAATMDGGMLTLGNSFRYQTENKKFSVLLDPSIGAMYVVIHGALFEGGPTNVQRLAGVFKLNLHFGF